MISRLGDRLLHSLVADGGGVAVVPGSGRSIEERGGDDRIAEDLAPFGEATVRGQDHGAFLVASIDELEEQVAASGIEVIEMPAHHAA